ncbi:MAG: hypothetical protein AB7P76_11625 [Candidatus Melainabacteria bacterium]
MGGNIPSLSQFTGLPASFLGGPAASSWGINNLLFGSANLMVPVNFGEFYTGIPPLLGGQGFQGINQTVPFAQGQPTLISPFTGGNLLNNTGVSPNPAFFAGQAPFNGIDLNSLFGFQANTGGLASIAQNGITAGANANANALQALLGALGGQQTAGSFRATPQTSFSRSVSPFGGFGQTQSSFGGFGGFGGFGSGGGLAGISGDPFGILGGLRMFG